MIVLLFWGLILSNVYNSNARMGVFEVTVANNGQLSKLEELATKLKWDFWKQPGIGKPIRFTAGSDGENIRYVQNILGEMNLSVKVINENLDQTINQEMKDNSLRQVKTMFRSSGGEQIYTYFASHKQYNQWLKVLKVQNRKLVTLINIGKTYEERDMIVIKLSSGPGKKAMLMDGGIHAREWLSISSVVWILNKIISGYKNKDSNVEDLLKKFDVYILPVTNPDGYEISRLGGQNRLWRKNTMPVENGCKGIDLNRNFDIDFGMTGVDFDPCSFIFPGEEAFTAPETKNFRDFVYSIKNELKLFISFHAYSQMLLTPWGYTKTPPLDNDEMMRVANIMVEAIYNVSGITYEAGSPGILMYEASGGCDDWVKSIGVKYSYTFEVRPDGQDVRGFVAPVEWIEPTGEELYGAVIAAARAVE